MDQSGIMDHADLPLDRAVQWRYVAAMKIATIPAVRVDPEFRAEAESVLAEGESLSEFVETSVRAGVERLFDFVLEREPGRDGDDLAGSTSLDCDSSGLGHTEFITGHMPQGRSEPAPA